MARMGHDNERAALIYQHKSSTADRQIADGLDALLRASRDRRTDDDDGTTGAQVPTGLWPANGPAAPRGPLTIKAQAGDTLSDLGLHMRAGDGNRTRTISMGITPIGASVLCDLRRCLAMSVRG